MGRILVVDDESAISDLLGEFLGSLGHEVECARDGVEALEVLNRARFDLVISDIHMPRMKGFELLKIVHDQYPNVKRALITAYDIEDYLALALEYDIGNIIAKTTPFCFDEVKRVVNSLLTEDIFGLEAHLDPATQIQREKIVSPDQIDPLALKVALQAGNQVLTNRIRLTVVELVTNALFYGARKADGEQKELWEKSFVVADDEAVEVCWGSDPNRFGVLIADPFGRLTKRTVLYWLARQTTQDEAGLPVGVFDSHGRGLFITRANVDRLLINVASGRRTEIIAIMHTGRMPKGSKPLYINEI